MVGPMTPTVLLFDVDGTLISSDGAGRRALERAFVAKHGDGAACRFSLGGFADDAEERATLIRVGAERGAKQLSTSLSKCRVVVIGDTPLDVAAARANGFESLAVATGPIARDELAKSGADAVVGDL